MFDKDSKTFNGLKVGNQQVAANSLTSHLWYTNGFPLAMVGKSDGTSLVMKPCLALVKVQINSESVPDYYFDTEVYTSSYGIDHNHDYSAVRGFNLYQKGASTIYSSGSFKVQVNDDGSLVTTAQDNKVYRQISQSSILQADTPYYMCLIPGGDITSFYLDFLGYSDSTGSISWDAVYSMTLPTTVSVDPGDFFDLGTLNPLGLKKEKSHASDEANDALVNNIDNIDWSDTDVVTVTSTATDYPQLSELKVIADQSFIYVRVAAPADTFDANYLDFFFADDGESQVYWPWTTKCTTKYNVEHAGALTSTSLSIAYNGETVDTKTETVGGIIYWYMSLPRAAHALTSSAGSVHFGLRIWKGWTMVGILPANGSAMMTVSLP